MLDSLKEYALKWKSTVNTEKTKVVMFRNGNNTLINECWLYDNVHIETADEICYLGIITFRYNNNLNKLQKYLSNQGCKALFALYGKCKVLSLNIETMLHLFDTYVSRLFMLLF